MENKILKNMLKCLTVAGLVAGMGALGAGCRTSSCSSCKAETDAEGQSSCGAKDASSCGSKDSSCGGH